MPRELMNQKSAGKSIQPPPSFLSSDLACRTATANLKPVSAGVTTDDLSALNRLKKILKTISSWSLPDLAVSVQSFCDYIAVLDTEKLLLEEEYASLCAANKKNHQNDLDQTIIFEMLERACISVEDIAEELRTSLTEARLQAIEFEAKNKTLSEQVRTLQERLSKTESELNQVYSWFPTSEHPTSIYRKFDPNGNLYKLLEFQEQRLAASRDVIVDRSVELADLKKDRARLREQIDRLESISKRFEKEAAEKNYQVHRYEKFFRCLCEPKRASEFAEMVAMKFKKAGRLHSLEGGSRTLSIDSMKKDGCLVVAPARITHATSQDVTPDAMAMQLQALDANNFQWPRTVFVRPTVPFPPSGSMERENNQDGRVAEPRQTNQPETASVNMKPSQLWPTLYPPQREQPGKFSGPVPTNFEDPGCGTS